MSSSHVSLHQDSPHGGAFEGDIDYSPAGRDYTSPTSRYATTAPHLGRDSLYSLPTRQVDSVRKTRVREPAIMTAIETATSLLDSLSLASTHPSPKQSPSRPPLSSSSRRGKTNSQHNSAHEYDSAHTANSYASNTSISSAPSTHPTFTLPSPLPTDAARLTVLLHTLHATHRAQTQRLRRAYSEADALAAELDATRHRVEALECKLAASEQSLRLGTPPLPPDACGHDGAGEGGGEGHRRMLASLSPFRDSRFAHASRTREVSQPRSIISLLPEEDVSSFPPHATCGGKDTGLMLGLGLDFVRAATDSREGSAWYENAENISLRARVCELEDMVEGVLGLVA